MDYFQGVYNVDWDFEKTEDGFELIVSVSFDGMGDDNFALRLSYDEFINMVNIASQSTQSLPEVIFFLDACIETNEYLFRQPYLFIGDIDKEIKKIERSINDYWGIPQCSHDDLMWLERQLKTIKE